MRTVFPRAPRAAWYLQRTYMVLTGFTPFHFLKPTRKIQANYLVGTYLLRTGFLPASRDLWYLPGTYLILTGFTTFKYLTLVW